MTELLPAVGLCLHVWCVQCERVTSACSKLQCLSKYDSTSDSQKLLLVILIITYTVVQIIHNRTFRTRITSVHDAFGKTWILLTSYLNKLRCETWPLDVYVSIFRFHFKKRTLRDRYMHQWCFVEQLFISCKNVPSGGLVSSFQNWSRGPCPICRNKT